MAFPATVNQLGSTRRRTRTSQVQGGGSEGDEVASEVGVGGPILDFGRPGGVRLNQEKGKWRWIWATEERQGEFRIIALSMMMLIGTVLKIVAESEGTLLFPPTKRVPPKSELSLDDTLRSAVSALDYLLNYIDI